MQKSVSRRRTAFTIGGLVVLATANDRTRIGSIGAVISEATDVQASRRRVLAAMKGHGLGVTNMKERLKLVGGELSIDSKPQGGTTIRARVPIRSEVKSGGTA